MSSSSQPRLQFALDQFVPAVVETAPPNPVAPVRRRKRTHDITRIAGAIEVEIAGMTGDPANRKLIKQTRTPRVTENS
jgi:hypothetical protein